MEPKQTRPRMLPTVMMALFFSPLMMVSEAALEGDSSSRKLSSVGLFGGWNAGVVRTSGPLFRAVMIKIQNGVSPTITTRIVKISSRSVRLR